MGMCVRVASLELKVTRIEHGPVLAASIEIRCR